MPGFLPEEIFDYVSIKPDSAERYKLGLNGGKISSICKT
jgi:hypothetical protein